MNKRLKISSITALGAVAVFLGAGAASCDKASEPFKDAPRDGTNNAPAHIITMPDGFNNVAAKCDGPDMVYVIYHGDSTYGAVTIHANDPRCSH